MMILIVHLLSFELARRFKLIPASAASRARSRCVSGGTRTTNLPLYCFVAIGWNGFFVGFHIRYNIGNDFTNAF